MDGHTDRYKQQFDPEGSTDIYIAVDVVIDGLPHEEEVYLYAEPGADRATLPAGYQVTTSHHCIGAQCEVFFTFDRQIARYLPVNTQAWYCWVIGWRFICVVISA